MQDCSISIVNTLDILQSCTEQSIKPSNNRKTSPANDRHPTYKILYITWINDGQCVYKTCDSENFRYLWKPNDYSYAILYLMRNNIETKGTTHIWTELHFKAHYFAIMRHKALSLSLINKNIYSIIYIYIYWIRMDDSCILDIWTGYILV